jgi:hypothetical protein
MLESVVFLKDATEEIATLESGSLTVHQPVNQLVAWAGSARSIKSRPIIEANY